jgi:hypothetical protein
MGAAAVRRVSAGGGEWARSGGGAHVEVALRPVVLRSK